ncbi:DUF3618 domain-containing protein [Sphingomonas abietis]|uniref:DUF3618 domain-containing protein n=1 Tax=Sphingomonas abietis TaxID=3012344 RepID=A0ABY7NIG1_9SPHN|nr:DUF3618 domain-containing protein [Sphingomonas abietis]WBO21259.1 DUF3618 domain-containing protein [Sphingomonas abietis]
MSLLKRLFSNVNNVEAAQAEADAARGRLVATIEEIHLRISPRNLMDEAMSQVRTRSAGIAQGASVIVRERPATVAAGAGVIALLLAAKPLARIAGTFLHKRAAPQETPAPKLRSPRKRKIAKTAQPASEG